MKAILLLLALITIQYTCTPGDTIQSIAEQHCPGNDPRQVAEFREGLRDLNYDAIGEGEVWPEVKLKINRWEEDPK